jgi:hypothetical protein
MYGILVFILISGLVSYIIYLIGGGIYGLINDKINEICDKKNN